MSPPRFAVLLMRLLLPARQGEAISGDLEEDWNTSPHPSRMRFWNLALRSIAACWMDGLRSSTHYRTLDERGRTGGGTVQSLFQDLRQGCRSLWRSPGFAVAAITTLALGIGVSSGVFGLLNVLSLEPLPYRDPARVAFLLGWDVEQGEMRFNLRQADFLDLQRHATSLDAVAAYTYLSANLTGGNVPERVQAYRVTPNTFSLLGVSAAVGRVFDEVEIGRARDDVAVISNGLWQRRFGGDSSIMGRPIVLNGEPYEVVGVMPPRFEYPVFNFKGDLWIPWRMQDAERGQANAAGSATVVGRLRQGVSYTQAQAELDTLMRAFERRYPETNRGLGTRLIEMGRLDDEQAGPAMSIVLITAAMVLLLSCANVANLLLARGISRHRELAVRAALGASRRRIFRQLLVEGLPLAFLGGAAGALLAMLALRALRASLPEMLVTTMPNIEQLGVDRTTLGYTLAIAALTSLLFGALPAWRASREQFQGGLKESASSGGSRGTRRLRTGLVVAEVALSTMLLIGAGLLVRSYAGLQHVSPGFESRGVLTMAMTLPQDTYPEAHQRRRFYDEVLERIERVPGVRAAGLVNVLPFSTYDRGTRLTVDGMPPTKVGDEPAVTYRVASPRYHETLQVPLIEGRVFDGRDRADNRPVALVNQTLARRYLVGGSAVGRRVRLGTGEAPWLTIVGVIGDVRHSELTANPTPELHVPLAQAPPEMMMLAIKSDTRPEALTGPVRDAIHSVDPAQPVYHVKTLDALVGDSLLAQRFSATMLLLFGALALVMAAVGIYGVIAYSVSQQTRELGVRVALGATPRDLLQLVLRPGVLMVSGGIMLGLAGAQGMALLMASVLYGVSPADPLTYLAVVALLAATGLVACSVPAWRASTAQPVTALRSE